MDFLFQTFLPYLLLYKYAALFTVTFLGALALPIPSAASLMAASAFASQGYFSLPEVILVAVLGNIAGDNLGYWIARLYGKQVLERIGFKRVLNSSIFRIVEGRVTERPALFIFFSRFEVIATLSVNLIAGLTKLSYARYLACEVIGEIAQVLAYASIGYFFGDNWQEATTLIGKLSLLAFAVAALFVGLLWKKIMLKISKLKSPPQNTDI
jgi:membrane protein DedA with SNARE-associated domain